MNKIDSFSEDYFFLSNFYLCDIVYKGYTFPSVEHAYQAMKSEDDNVHWLFSKNEYTTPMTSGQAKKTGRKIANIRKDWEDVKVGIMRNLLEIKFSDPQLMSALKSTSNAELIEGNWWGDCFWGVCRGKGKNTLGKLLMEIRDGLG